MVIYKKYQYWSTLQEARSEDDRLFWNYWKERNSTKIIAPSSYENLQYFSLKPVLKNLGWDEDREWYNASGFDNFLEIVKDFYICYPNKLQFQIKNKT